MKNKILLIIFLFIISINVKALKCEYTVDRNNIGIVITASSDEGVNVQLSGGYYLMPGNVNNIGTFTSLNENSECPNKVYYACNAQHFCKLNSFYFTDSQASIYGYVDFKSNGSDEGTATVSSVIKNFKMGNSCGALNGLIDLIQENVEMPLIITSIVLFIIMTTIEYAKVVFSEDSSPKKANEKTLKRGIAMIFLGLSPFIIQLLIKLSQLPLGC